MMLVPRLHFASFADGGRAPDGVHVVVRGFQPDGKVADLQMAVSSLDMMIAALTSARDRARATGADTSANVNVFLPTTWQAGVNAHDPSYVLLTFDADMPSRAAFMLGPETAREMGRGLIGQAREAETLASRIRRN